MKSLFPFLLLLAILQQTFAAAGPAEPLPDRRARVSYAFGLTIGQSWRRVAFDFARVAQGLDSGLHHAPSLYAAADLNAAFSRFIEPGRSATTAPRDRDLASFAFGLGLAAQWQAGGMDLDPAFALRGLRDAQSDRSALLSVADAATLFHQYGRELMTQQEQRRARLADENARHAEDFLARHLSTPGVVGLPGGLQYRVIHPGRGTPPTLGQWVKVNYSCRRLDGTLVESSAPASGGVALALSAVIRGWADALALMPPGSKWRLWVPPELAYAREGAPNIGPNELLVYDLELVAVLDTQPQPTAEDLRNERTADGD